MVHSLQPGDTTPWFASFWDFCSTYLNTRFGKDWCLGPEQSLSLHAGNRTVPAQLLVRTPKGGNKPTELLHGTSIFDMRTTMPDRREITEEAGVQVYTTAAALVAVSTAFFTQRPTDARTVLSLFSDALEILAQLLEGGHSTIAGRLAGAFRNIGRGRIAGEILKGMDAAGYTVREIDPFESHIQIALPRRETSSYAGRIRLMWQEMREAVAANFPPPSGKPNDIAAYLKRVDDV